MPRGIDARRHGSIPCDRPARRRLAHGIDPFARRPWHYSDPLERQEKAAPGMQIVLDYYAWKLDNGVDKTNVFAGTWKDNFAFYASSPTHPVSRIRFIKGALVGGYGLIGTMINDLTANPAEIAHLYGLMRSRYTMLASAFTLAAGQPVLTTSVAWKYIEQSERTVASFLLGGACAFYGVTTWLKSWQVPQGVADFYHYGIYTDPALSNLGLMPFGAAGQRPDYLCRAYGNGHTHWFWVEAKARLNKGLEWGDEDVAGAMAQATSVPVLVVAGVPVKVHFPEPVVTYAGMSRKGPLSRVRLSLIDPPADPLPDQPARDVPRLFVSDVLLRLSSIVGAVVTRDALAPRETQSKMSDPGYDFFPVDADVCLGLPHFMAEEIDTPRGARTIAEALVAVYFDLAKIGAAWLRLSSARERDALDRAGVLRYLEEAVAAVGGTSAFRAMLDTIEAVERQPPHPDDEIVDGARFVDLLLPERQSAILPADLLVRWLNWIGVVSMVTYVERQTLASARLTRLNLNRRNALAYGDLTNPVEDAVACGGLWILESEVATRLQRAE